MCLILICNSSIFFYIISISKYGGLFWPQQYLHIIIVSIYIYPSYISPLFNKFDNLDDDEIKSEIEDLSKQTNFSIKNLYVWINLKEQNIQMHTSQDLKIIEE